MDTSSFNCNTPEVRRLVSFHRTPLPNHQKLSLSNSPAKLATAGFMRRTDAFKDDVCCESCGIMYGDWAGESPYAVHRVLNETCPILTNSSAVNDVLQHPRVVHARRQLFPVDGEVTDRVNNRSNGEEDSDGSADSAEENADSENGDFVSRSDEESIENQADDVDSAPFSGMRRKVCVLEHMTTGRTVLGMIIFNRCADKVKCYSCGVGVYRWRQGSDPWTQHARHMPACPHLAMTKGHHFTQQAAETQALTEADLPSSSASPGSPDWGSEVTGEVWRSAPGSLTMDVCAVTAALTTSQYTPQQVRHAVLTFFSHTSRYPTKDILLGTLRAADDNFTTVCQQRETIHQKDTALQQKDTALQQKDTALQQKDTALQQKDTVIEQTYTALQQKDTVVEQVTQELQQKNEIIHQHQLEQSVREEELQVNREELQVNREELQVNREELQVNREELERRRRQMSYQESQIQSLRIQMQALLAERRQAGPQAASLRAPGAPAQAAPNRAPDNNDDDDGGEGPMVCDIRCKVCLCAESNTILQPCHHITCCSRCAHQLFNNCCPVCRAPIRNVLPAYIS
ncbi:hypothetical protein ACOMHN_063308 [Nucella lapillus]